MPSGNGVHKKDPSQSTAIGSAVILDFDYLSAVYEVHAIGEGETHLSGPKEPPTGHFEVLIHTADGFVEYVASVLTLATDNRWCLKLEARSAPRFLQKPTGDQEDKASKKRKLG